MGRFRFFKAVGGYSVQTNACHSVVPAAWLGPLLWNQPSSTKTHIWSTDAKGNGASQRVQALPSLGLLHGHTNGILQGRAYRKAAPLLPSKLATEQVFDVRVCLCASGQGCLLQQAN